MPRIDQPIKEKKESEIPKTLQPYLWHGVDLEFSPGKDDAIGDCPFCDKEGKFAVTIDTGKFKCWSCQQGNAKGGGNYYTFMRSLWEYCLQDDRRLIQLADERKLLGINQLKQWGVRWSPYTEEWVVPGYSQTGKFNQLYRYVYDINTRKYRWMATPPKTLLTHCIFGLNLFKEARPDIFVLEGLWDGIALSEILPFLKKAKKANIIALPGCNVFREQWVSLFSGKNVYFIFDNDHDRTHKKTGNVIPSPALQGMKRAVGILMNQTKKPKSVRFLQWGDENSYYDPELEHGYDLRDFLSSTRSARTRAISFTGLCTKKMVNAPTEWAKEYADKLGKDPNALTILPCNNWKDLKRQWLKAMQWTEGMDRSLSVMLSSVLSTSLQGEQLWVKIMGPPSTAKTTLAEAIAVDKDHVMSVSKMTSFHSGYKTDKHGTEDVSLLAEALGKTLIIKDADTLLQNKNRDDILAQMRDIYDGMSRARYGHGLKREYAGIRMTIILCGTSGLRALDQSELGARYIDCIIMDEIDPELEELVIKRVAYRAMRNIAVSVNGAPESHQDEALIMAKRLTGGYVSFLRNNAAELLSKVQTDHSRLIEIGKYAQFVAYMRARESKKQDEVVEREFSSRLTEQFCRLAGMLAVVLSKFKLDNEVMDRVKKVAIDTSRGRSLNLAEYLYNCGDKGAFFNTMANRLGEAEVKLKNLLWFLRKIGVVETFFPTQNGRSLSRPRWRLTKRLRELYTVVMEPF